MDGTGDRPLILPAGTPPARRESRFTGLAFLAGFACLASGSGSPAVVLGFWAALVIAWGWLAALSIHLYRAAPHPDCDRRAAASGTGSPVLR